MVHFHLWPNDVSLHVYMFSDAEDWFCECPWLYTGRLCQFNACERNPCSHGATCIPKSPLEAACLCPYGRQGLLCDERKCYKQQLHTALHRSMQRRFSSFIKRLICKQLVNESLEQLVEWELLLSKGINETKFCWKGRNVFLQQQSDNQSKTHGCYAEYSKGLFLVQDSLFPNSCNFHSNFSYFHFHYRLLYNTIPCHTLTFHFYHTTPQP